MPIAMVSTAAARPLASSRRCVADVRTFMVDSSAPQRLRPPQRMGNRLATRPQLFRKETMSGRRVLARRIAETRHHDRLIGRSSSMSQFLYLYRMSDASRQENMGTPERAQQSMQRWMAG